MSRDCACHAHLLSKGLTARLELGLMEGCRAPPSPKGMLGETASLTVRAGRGSGEHLLRPPRQHLGSRGPDGGACCSRSQGADSPTGPRPPVSRSPAPCRIAVSAAPSQPPRTPASSHTFPPQSRWEPPPASSCTLCCEPRPPSARRGHPRCGGLNGGPLPEDVSSSKPQDPQVCPGLGKGSSM